MNLRSFVTASFVGLALCAGSATAFADVLPPNSEGCDDANPEAVGQSCMTDDGVDGTCLAQTCTGLDYANRDDAGAPGTKTYACAICYPPDGGPVTTGDGGPVTTGVDGGIPTLDSADGGGCNVGGANVGAGAAMLLALVFPLVARRRKRS
jgi:MYXO-CTERM domain-containing protein